MYLGSLQGDNFKYIQLLNFMKFYNGMIDLIMMKDIFKLKVEDVVIVVVLCEV